MNDGLLKVVWSFFKCLFICTPKRVWAIGHELRNSVHDGSILLSRDWYYRHVICKSTIALHCSHEFVYGTLVVCLP